MGADKKLRPRMWAPSRAADLESSSSKLRAAVESTDAQLRHLEERLAACQAVARQAGEYVQYRAPIPRTLSPRAPSPRRAPVQVPPAEQRAQRLALPQRELVLSASSTPRSELHADSGAFVLEEAPRSFDPLQRSTPLVQLALHSSPSAGDVLHSLPSTRKKTLRSRFKWRTIVDALYAQGIKDAESAFKYIDSDGSGMISHEELRGAADRLGLPCTDEDCARLMREADKDGNGEVDLDEFLAWQVALRPFENTFVDARGPTSSRSTTPSPPRIIVQEPWSPDSTSTRASQTPTAHPGTIAALAPRKVPTLELLRPRVTPESPTPRRKTSKKVRAEGEDYVRSASLRIIDELKSLDKAIRRPELSNNLASAFAALDSVSLAPELDSF